jgi:hypothetical protein
MIPEGSRLRGPGDRRRQGRDATVRDGRQVPGRSGPEGMRRRSLVGGSDVGSPGARPPPARRPTLISQGSCLTIIGTGERWNAPEQ